MIPNSILNLIGKNTNLGDLKGINSPDELAQRLLNSGYVNQNQVNQAKQMWNQPNVRQMIQNKYQY